MTDTVTSGMDGLGLGGGLIGGLLLGSLLRNGNGLLGGDNGGGQAALAQLQANTDNAIAAQTALMAARFDADAQRQIQADINSTASATQLAQAIQNSAIGVEVQKTAGEIGTQNALNAATLGVQVQKTAGDTQTQIATQTAALGVQSEKTAAANALALTMGQRDLEQDIAVVALQQQLTALTNANTAAAQLAQTQFNLATAIKADGDQTRAIIIANNDAELNRRLVTAQNEIIELRGDARSVARGREVEVNVSQTVLQNQNQIQAQQQQQQQLAILGQIAFGLNNLTQVAHATQQAINVGNSGAITGTQTANPTNVSA